MPDLLTEDLFGIGELAAVSLHEVLASAALLERTDRKYLVRRTHVDQLVSDLSQNHRVLEIAGRRSTTYCTTYFDSEDLRNVRDHIQGRRRRFKARTRWYVEDDLCRLEVKTKGHRGQTVKVFLDVDAASRRHLDAEQRSFVSRELEAARIHQDQPLTATIDVTYRRTTLVDTIGETRLTIDGALTCDWNGRTLHLDDDWQIVETKNVGHTGPADLQLHRLGYRPRRFSKYAAAGAALHNDIPANNIRKLLGTQLHVG